MATSPDKVKQMYKEATARELAKRKAEDKKRQEERKKAKAENRAVKK